MRKALRHRRLLLPVLGVTVLPLTIAACSSSPAASSGASTTTGNSSTSSAPPADQTECVLISPSTVRATTGEAVGTPHAVIHGAVTTCTYKAAVPSKSVIIEYDTAATPTTFAADKSEIERGKGVTTTSIQGLGNDAYAFTLRSSGDAVNTVVSLQGTLETIVTGTSQPGNIETLAEEIIYLIDEHDASAATSQPAG